MPKTYLLTGETASGKTTNLKFWCKRTSSVDGILSPVLDNRRCMLHIRSGEMREMETNPEDASALKVGRYHFRPDVFKWGQKVLEKTLQKNPRWLVIDECGPLELDGKGFAPFLEELNKLRSTNLVIVVRNNSVDGFLEKFQPNLGPFKLITLSDLKYLG